MFGLLIEKNTICNIIININDSSKIDTLIYIFMSKTPMIVLNNQLCLFNDKSLTCNLYVMQLQIVLWSFNGKYFMFIWKRKKNIMINYNLLKSTILWLMVHLLNVHCNIFLFSKLIRNIIKRKYMHSINKEHFLNQPSSVKGR